jgi:hypothetical protein
MPESNYEDDRRGNPAWKPGVSGNPAGRPKKEQTLTDLLTKYGEKVHKKTQKQYRALLIERMWYFAIKGDMAIAKYIVDRIDGKMREYIDHSGSMNTNISQDIHFEDMPKNLQREYLEERLKVLDAERKGSHANKQRLDKK